MGLFKPDWMSSNVEKALIAIANIDDQRKLYEIAKKAYCWQVRIAAIEKIDDQRKLAEMTNYGYYWQVRIAAIEKLDEKQHRLRLFYILKNDNDLRVCEAAMKKLSDNDSLIYILNKKISAELCRMAIEKIDKRLNQLCFANIARGSWFSNNSDDDRQLSMLAVKKLTDQALLVDIVKNSIYSNVRQIALDKLDGPQNLFANIAMNTNRGKDHSSLWESDEILGKAAIGKITDQNFLADIAKKADNVSIRIEAIKAMDSEMFTVITKEMEKWGVCEETSRFSGIELGHFWDGCVCIVCHSHRDFGHNWDGCVCRGCHSTRDFGHSWNSTDGWRTEYCTKCNARGRYTPRYDD